MLGLKIRFPVLAVLLLLPLFFSCSEKKKAKVLVIHSYEPSYPSNEKINSTIEKEFRKNDIDASLEYFYLDCERYGAVPEIELFGKLFDSLSANYQLPDLILVNDDQATYSLLKTGYPALKKIPIVFMGVNFPDWDLLAEYADNVTGLWQKPDYLKTISMIKKLWGNINITYLSDTTVLGKHVDREIDKQLADSGIRRRFRGSVDSAQIVQRGENPVLTNLPIRVGTGVGALWFMNGINSNGAIMLTKRDITAYKPIAYSTYPLFTAINEGFGQKQGIIAGYMPPLKQDISNIISIASSILKGTAVKDIPIRQSENEYLIDWNEMKRWKIDRSLIPDNWRIVNEPFWEEHYILMVALSLLFVAGMLGIIFLLGLKLKTEKHNAALVQEDLDWKQNILSLALESGNIFAWKYDVVRKIITFDKEFFEYLHIPAVEYASTQAHNIIHPDDYEGTMEMLRKYIQTGGEKLVFNIRVRFSGEKYYWWEFRCSPVIRKESGGEMFFVGICLSVQEYKDRENELILARDLASKAELKESFLANMSHEIRTPLNAIVGFSNLLILENDFSQEEKREFIDSINKNCEMLLKLINDILEISRIESGNMSFKFEEVNLRDFIREICATYAILMPAGVEFLKVEAKEDIVISTDRVRLNQVLTNFVNNSVKFTAKGFIRVGYYLGGNENTPACSEREICIYVEDTGKGIPKEQQQMIFNRFYKQDEFAQGTGLGLSICSVIVQKFGGYITIDSSPGEGSRFTIHLPFNDKCRIEGESEKGREEKKKGMLTGKKKKPVILVAEDIDSNYLLIKAALQEEYEIIRVINGEGAIKMVHSREDIRLILMDIKMIGMNGLEATAIIREGFPHIPVIIQTAYAMEYDRQMAEKAGCVDFMTKPINPSVLREKMARFIKK